MDSMVRYVSGEAGGFGVYKHFGFEHGHGIFLADSFGSVQR